MTSPLHRLTLAATAATLWVAGAALAQEAAVLSETRPGGIGVSLYQEISGRWRDSTGKSTAQGLTANIGSRTADLGTSGDEGARARWTLTPPGDGVYDVQVTWSTSGNASNVLYRVSVGGETTEIHLDQDGYGYLGPRNANQWLSLGSFACGPSTPVQVEVSERDVSGQPDEASPGRIYADAARLVASAGVPSAPMIASAPAAPPSPSPTASVPPADFAPVTAPPADDFDVAMVEPAPDFVPADAVPAEPVAPTAEPVAPAPVATAASTIAWSNNWDSAYQLAETSGRDLLVCFVTLRSRDVRRMEADTWTNPAVVEAVAGTYVPVRIDMEAAQQLCAQLGIYRSPTTAIIRPRGGMPTVVSRIVGYTSAQDMLTALRAPGGTTP